MNDLSRRHFLRESVGLGAAAVLSGVLHGSAAAAADMPGRQMKIGLCTYLWGQDWDLPTVIANCEKSRILGVELRTEHRHGVEPSLSPRQRREVKKLFADSPVTFVGLGTNQCFDSPDADQLRQSIQTAKAFLQLSYDCGGSGVKVKPNDFHPGVPLEKTVQQIGRSLNILGAFAAERGQQVRLEVHGSCRELPTVKRIMDIADHPSVALCWNCNVGGDLRGKGLEYNFSLVKNRFGATLHIHELDSGKYPYRQLFKLLAGAHYAGWALLECVTTQSDRVAAMAQQRRLFDRTAANSP